MNNYPTLKADGCEAESLFNQRISIVAGVLILIFPALLMTIPGGGGGALLLLMIVSFIGLFYKRKRNPLNKIEYRLILVVLFFFAVYLINVLCFDTGLGELDNVSRFIMLLPIFFYLRKVKIRAEYFFLGIIFGAISCGVFAFYQVFYLGLLRANGITNAVPFGDISIVLGLMCLPGVLLTTIPKPFRLLLLIGFFMGLAGSILSGTRGGWIAIPVGLLVIIFMNPMKWGAGKKALSIVILFASLAGAYYLPGIQERIDIALSEFNEYFSKGAFETSVGLRLEIWRASMLAISENLIFGVGEGNFHKTMQALIDEGRANASVKNMAHVHNEFLSATLNRGLIGLVSLILIFIVPLSALIKSTSQGSGLSQLMPISGVILITSYMVFSLTDVVFGHQNTTLLYAAYILIIFGVISSKQ